jgi:DNA-binding NarL/FixJ family response regulator
MPVEDGAMAQQVKDGEQLPPLSVEDKWVLQTVLETGAERRLGEPARRPARMALLPASPPLPATINAASYQPLRLPPYRLTARELEVLVNLMMGHSNKETAIALGISPRTVELHRAHIMEKLGTRSAIQLVDVVRSITGRDRGSYA